MLQIVTYPHPTLRHKSSPVTQINRRLREIVAQMFELMYEAKGVGLAANQVNLPLRLFVVNLAGAPGEGEERVYINPILSRPKGNEEQEEGCLSLPGLYAPVRRPAHIRVASTNLLGEEVLEDLSGLHARVVQHETDHLDGVLITDRLTVTSTLAVQDSLIELELEYRSRKERGFIASDAEIVQNLRSWEREFCSL
jgi:peptide deformylase